MDRRNKMPSSDAPALMNRNVPRVPTVGAGEVWQPIGARVKSAVLFPNSLAASTLTRLDGLPRMAPSRAGAHTKLQGGSMRLLTKIAGGLALSLLLAAPARAEKCKFGPVEGPL